MSTGVYLRSRNGEGLLQSVMVQMHVVYASANKSYADICCCACDVSCVVCLHTQQQSKAWK